MTLKRFAAMSIIALGFASTASAQGPLEALTFETPRATVRMNPLDPVSRAAMLAARNSLGPVNTPATTPDRVVFMPAQQQPVAQPVPATAEERPAGPSRFMSTLQGISQTLQVSHEALDVYEHAIEANALKNLYNGR